MSCLVVLKKIFWIDSFFSQPNHSKICREQTHVKMDLGELLRAHEECPTCQRPKSGHYGLAMNTWLLDQPKSWQGSNFPTLKGLDVFTLFTGAIFLVANSLIPPNSQLFARSTFLRVCLQSILTEAALIYTSLDLFTLSKVYAFLCCLYW